MSFRDNHETQYSLLFSSSAPPTRSFSAVYIITPAVQNNWAVCSSKRKVHSPCAGNQTCFSPHDATSTLSTLSPFRPVSGCAPWLGPGARSIRIPQFRSVVFLYSSGNGDGIAGTVSGEIFGHHRSRSNCFPSPTGWLHRLVFLDWIGVYILWIPL